MGGSLGLLFTFPGSVEPLLGGLGRQLRAIPGAKGRSLTTRLPVLLDARAIVLNETSRATVEMPGVSAAAIPALVAFDRHAVELAIHQRCPAELKARFADVDLFADQRMRHRVEEALDLDMIVDANAGEMPVGILVVLLRQGLHGGSLDRVEELTATDAETAHLTAVHPLEGRQNRGVAFGQGKERDVTQATENVALGETDFSLNGRFGDRCQLQAVWARPAGSCASPTRSIRWRVTNLI